MNAFAFGQCDVIYTAFLVWFVVFTEREKPALAALMFGLAFAFKAQALFLAPLVLYRLPVRCWAIIPLTYVGMMLPAALAGRPWGELLTVYAHQAELVHDLFLNAPNPWWLLRGVNYSTGVVVGLALGAATTLAVSVWAWWTKAPVLLVAALCAVLLPFVLPKMTSRYFFVADVLTLALAFRDPRTWPIAALVQAASLIACLSYFATFGTAIFGLQPMTLALVLLARQQCQFLNCRPLSSPSIASTARSFPPCDRPRRSATQSSSIWPTSLGGMHGRY